MALEKQIQEDLKAAMFKGCNCPGLHKGIKAAIMLAKQRSASDELPMPTLSKSFRNW